MRGPARGFSLLEAIVALAILAAALLGAYTWVGTDMAAIVRVRDLALEEAAVQQAVAEIEQFDLATQSRGSIAWRDFDVHWQAQPVEDTRPGRTPVGGQGRWDFTLYEVQLQVLLGGRLIGTPSLRMLRYAPRANAGDRP